MFRLTIEPHSFIDVITNSSTELFVCDTYKSVEAVKAVIQTLLDAYNGFNDNNDEYLFLDEILEVKVGDGDDLGGWEEYYPINTKGKIVITGTDDNSIPYELQQSIEGILNARRCHLG